MNDNYIKIAEIAEQIGVTKQAIHQRIKKEPLSTSLRQLMKKKGQSLTVHVDGVNLIKKEFEDKKTVNDKPSIDVNDHQRVDGDNLQLIIETFTRQLEEKDNQLKEKDNQLKSLNDRLAESQELNRNQQVLLKNEQEKLLMLENKNNENAKSLFDKIFNRKKTIKIK